jgi:hypothetical protein
MVSGLAALIWTETPTATSDQVWASIRDGAEDLGSPGRDDLFGWGRIDAERSLHAASAVSAAGALPPPVGLPLEPASARVAYRPGEVIVSVCGGAAASDLGLAVLEAGPRAGVYLVRVPVGEEVASALALQKLDWVAYAHPNHILSVADR